MRDHSADLLDALTDSFSCVLYVDVFHGSDRVLERLTVTSWSYDAVLDASINVSGTCSITYNSEAGESLVPSGVEGDLSPYRATLLLMVEISNGAFVEQVELGWLKVTSIPSARDFYYTSKVTGLPVIYASQVDVEYQSLDANIQAWGFRYPEQPPSLTSVYDEIRRISQMPVTETLTDVAIPKATVYEAADGGRLSAVQMLFKILGGVGIVDSDGAWRCVPYTWPTSADATLQYGGDLGTIVQLPYSIDTQGVANVVVGSFQNPITGAPLYAIAKVPSGQRLSPDGEWGEHTRYITDDSVTTNLQAIARVATELSTVTQSQRYRVDVECVINPLIELGDMVTVSGYIKPLFGRVVEYHLSGSATMHVVLEVKRDL